MENTDRNQVAKNITLITYCLYAAGLFTGGIVTLVAFIINIVKKGDVAGTIYESHFRWQMRTALFGLLWMVIGMVTVVFVIGGVILFVATIWYIYRVIKGFLYFNDGKPMYA